MQGDAIKVNPVFQEDGMAWTSRISETLAQFLVDISGFMDEVEVVDVDASEEQQPNDVDKFEEGGGMMQKQIPKMTMMKCNASRMTIIRMMMRM